MWNSSKGWKNQDEDQKAGTKIVASYKDKNQTQGQIILKHFLKHWFSKKYLLK